ncbi:MAG: TetR/AcrR family transcriptional regulator [Bradyrhizobiaceae bacterium]|nr:MAG: TetR/AcrR family transcriptional regulator [Bradyrhizobiaceae bacterium]
MSTELPLAREPKRARGRQRVASLLDAAAALFVEKGYDATTTAAIAERAGASIGSLYQFFPTKQTIAEALFERYQQHVAAAVRDFVARAPHSSPREIADMLVELMLGLKSHRDVAAALSNAVTEIAERRERARGILRREVVTILKSANPRLTSKQATVAAALIAQMIKSVPAFADEDKSIRSALLAGVREMLTLYITHIVET